MKPSRGKLPLPIITVVICAFAIVALLYTQRITSPLSQLNSQVTGMERMIWTTQKPTTSLIFDPEECSIVNGKWVFNSSVKPLYTDRSCPYLDRQVSCAKNGRPDSAYRHWEWQLDDCELPRFNPKTALKKLRGKRLMFVGDSLQRGQWQSFVCLVEHIIPEDKKSMHRGRSHSVFKAKEYNTTIEFYWAPFLVESNSDLHIIGDPRQRILRVDSVSKHAKHWLGVDILVFNTYVWWMSGLRIKSLTDGVHLQMGEEGYEELDAPVAYRSADWNNKDGIKCYNETKPVMKRGHWGTGSDKRIMNVVDSIVEKMKVPVTVINITQMSEHRVDAHSSVYTETQGKLLTEEQKADPLRYADCIHWCLPGVPDTWNQAFLAYL
ncbi:Protein trichome birefringence-like 3 [Vitis vinifera]|uniref:Protein trichome birefringence-like 3 n=1 Tax=Vitis vinifera TaxID=29760 RepID=A0A438DAP6_VITVI|nr:Protein trichome birefringence-like 3 [Vitis vinifera]